MLPKYSARFLKQVTRSFHSIKVGVFGGMGPTAGADFYARFEQSFGNMPDHEHPITYLYSNPTMPRKDLSVKQMLRGERPTLLIEQLVAGLKFFQTQEVDFVVVPCNTFHYFLPVLLKQVDIKILNMIQIVTKATVDKLKAHEKKIGLLATEATLLSELYQKEFDQHHIETILPTQASIQKVMRIIENVKLGQASTEETTTLLAEVIDEFKNQNIQTIILGCTELPLVPLNTKDQKLTIIDTTLCLINGAHQEIERLKASHNKSASSVNSFTISAVPACRNK